MVVFDFPDGYEGILCNIEKNECIPSPCVFASECVDELGGFDCICLPGYEGDTCNININECIPDPCLNAGVCVDMINDFRCACMPGYTGGYFCITWVYGLSV